MCMQKKVERKKILLVDDNDREFIHLKEVLNDRYDIIVAKSDMEILKHLYRGFVPDLILLTLILSGTEGSQILRRIKAINFLHRIPVALLSSGQEADDEKYEDAKGAADFIAKPFFRAHLKKRNDLKKRIDAILNIA